MLCQYYERRFCLIISDSHAAHTNNETLDDQAIKMLAGTTAISLQREGHTTTWRRHIYPFKEKP